MNTKTSNKSILYRMAAIFMIVMILLAAMPVSPAQAAPLTAVGVGVDFGVATVAAGNTAAGTADMTAITGAYNVGAGSNRLLVVVAQWESAAIGNTSTFTSGSYGGQALTSLTLNGSAVARNRIWVGYLKEAGIAAAASTTLNLNFANSANPTAWVVRASWFNGIDQTMPINNFVNSSNEAPGIVTHDFGANLTVINGGRAIYFESTNQNRTYTAPVGYSENFDANDTSPGAELHVTAGSKAIVANGTENPTITQSAAARYSVTAISLNPAVPPTITSVTPANGIEGIAYNHTFTATGAAPITFSVTGGALPTGLSLSAAGAITGTPTTTGTFNGTVTATNGIVPDATQAFSITINQAPAITSANNISFTLGVAGTFTVTKTGSPVPTLSIAGDPLPAGVTFTPATGILAGTPAAGTGGTYNLTFTAANGVSPDAVQNFTLTVTDGPSITSANNTTFSLGLPGTFTVTAVGAPAPTLSISGAALPAGVTFTPGTGILAGTPTAVGVYSLTFTATNGVLPDATQSFTLTVKNGPIVVPNGINSVPDTGNGSISNNESIVDTLGINKLIVKFDQDVYDPALNTGIKDVTNPANYMLVLGSSAGVFQTVSCSPPGVVSPDIAITVNSVTYNNNGGAGPFVATLNINGGNPLNVVGFYRLYVCGTTSIVDAANINLELAGNGTTPGTDFVLNFRIQTSGAAGGGGGSNNNAASSVSSSVSLIPASGFAPNKVALLPVQPKDKAYKSLGEIRIEIPTLGINYPIVGAMIDKNTWDLTWLKDSVAYLEGSAYPTLAGNTVLTAHVLDANNNLGPFSDIKGLQAGQMIYIHANRQIYVYQVQENQNIFPTNISAAFKHEEYSWITLVTCEDYNAKTGAYKYRRMVRAVLISVISEK